MKKQIKIILIMITLLITLSGKAQNCRPRYYQPCTPVYVEKWVWKKYYVKYGCILVPKYYREKILIRIK